MPFFSSECQRSGLHSSVTDGRIICRHWADKSVQLYIVLYVVSCIFVFFVCEVQTAVREIPSRVGKSTRRVPQVRCRHTLVPCRRRKSQCFIEILLFLKLCQNRKQKLKVLPLLSHPTWKKCRWDTWDMPSVNVATFYEHF